MTFPRAVDRFAPFKQCGDVSKNPTGPPVDTLTIAAIAITTPRWPNRYLAAFDAHRTAGRTRSTHGRIAALFGCSFRSTTATLAWTLFAFYASPIAAQQFPLVLVAHTQNNPNAVGKSTSRLVVLLPPVGYNEDGPPFLTSTQPISFRRPPAIFYERSTTELPKLAVPNNDITPPLITDDDKGPHFCRKDNECHPQQHTWQFLPEGLLLQVVCCRRKRTAFCRYVVERIRPRLDLGNSIRGSRRTCSSRHQRFRPAGRMAIGYRRRRFYPA